MSRNSISAAHPTMILKAITGNNTPERKNVWNWMEVLDPDPELARLICHSLGYSTRQEVEEAVARIDALEKQE